MIFKTIEDESTISEQRIVGALQARKIAQQQATVQLETDITCLKKYEIACQSGSVSAAQFDNIMKKASVTAKEYTTNIQNGTGSAQSYAQAQKVNNAALQSVGVGAGIASNAVKLLSAAMNSLIFTTVFSAISKGIQWVSNQINDYIHRNEIAIEKAEELLNTFNSELDDITSKQSTLKSLEEEFNKLSRGVDEYGKNVSLTTDEYEKYQDIVETIVDVNPSLITGWDEEGNILARKNGLLENSIQLLKDEYQQKIKNMALPDNIGTAIDGAVGRYNASKEKFHNVDIPNSLVFSGVKIDVEGNEEYGYVNQIPQYIEDVIGVEFKNEGIDNYILNNAEAVFNNLDKIKERATETKDEWKGLTDSQIIDLMDYFRELQLIYNDMNTAASSANSTLQYVAMAEDSYARLTDKQKVFLSDYINGIKITTETTVQEKDTIRKSIITITNKLANHPDANQLFENLYTLPKDELPTDEYIARYKQLVEDIIKALDSEDGMGLSEEQELEIRARFNISNDENNINTMKEDLKTKLQDEFDNQVGSLSYEDLKIAYEKLELDSSVPISWDALITKIDEYKTSLENADETNLSIDTYKTASNSISNLATAFKELTDNEYISLETISKIKEAVGDSISNWDEYEEKLLSVKKGTAEYNQLMSELTYATLEKQLGGVNALAQADEKRVARLLEENGVLHANEVAHNAVERAKFKNQIQTIDLATAEESEINALKNKVIQLGYTEAAFWNLIAQEQIFNNTTLDITQQITALKDLEIQAGITSEKFAGLTGSGGTVNDKINDALALGVTSDLKNGISFNGKLYGKGQDALNQAMRDAALYAFQEDLKKKYNQSLEFKYEDLKVDYSNLNSNQDTKESFNWIETALSRVQRAITNLGKKVSATYKSWTSRNHALGDEIAAVNKEITLQQDALSAYKKKADNVNLDPAIKEKVRNGSISIEEYSGSTVELIQEYQEWYEKSLACEDALQDLNDQLATLAKTKFDNVANEFDNLLSSIEHDTSMLDAYITLAETSGHMVSSQYYDSLIATEKENLSTLENKYSSLTTELNKAMNTGKIQMYSEEWYNMMSVINGVEQAMMESKTAMVEYNNALQDLDWNNFDKLQEKLSQVTEESNFLIDLMSDEKLFNDSGNMTDYGQATLGLHTANYKTYLAQAEKYAEELEAINEKLANDPYNETLLERQEELLQSHRDMISAANDEKQSMKDLYSNGYDVLLDNMSKVIDKRKEMFSQIKDLYDYEKNITEQTKEIASLEKQLSAYRGDDSEETRTTIQQLKVSLEEAKENLEETEYDKYIGDQEQMLDTLYDETEAWVNDRLDNIDGLLQDAIDSATLNADEIMSTLQTVANEAGITLSDKMDTIWSSGGSIGTLLTQLQQWFSDAKQAADETANEQITGEASSTPATSSTSQPASTPTPVSTETASSWGSWFIKKKDSYNKSKLNKESSIVDRLKYLDYDSSFDARASYYAAMGGSGTYTGSSAQNQWMLAQMKANAFANGGIVGNLIKKSGEDGFALVRRGEGIIPVDMMPEWEQLIQNLQPINHALEAVKNVHLPENANAAGNQYFKINGVTLEFPNVKDANDFITDLQHSKRFENIIHEIAFGKGQLTKYKY